MNPTLVAALIAAFVAVIGGVANLIATYRLKVKEFRVTQNKSRIDTLEQAMVSAGPESNSLENRTEENLSRAVNAMKAAAWYRLTETEKHYSKYKWLLDPESHPHIEKLLAECWKLNNELAVASLNDSEKFIKGFPAFSDKTLDLQKTYEKARLSAIERLYRTLNKDVGA